MKEDSEFYAWMEDMKVTVEKWRYFSRGMWNIRQRIRQRKE